MDKSQDAAFRIWCKLIHAPDSLNKYTITVDRWVRWYRWRCFTDRCDLKWSYQTFVDRKFRNGWKELFSFFWGRRPVMTISYLNLFHCIFFSVLQDTNSNERSIKVSFSQLRFSNRLTLISTAIERGSAYRLIENRLKPVSRWHWQNNKRLINNITNKNKRKGVFFLADKLPLRIARPG